MKIWLQKHKYMLLFSILLILSFIGFMNFKKIIDRTVKQRTMPIEYLVVHWTANTATGADARANAIYLKKKENAGTHYCIDDEEIYQCTEDKNVAYSVGGKYWSGFVPKMWLARKIFNNNSLNFEAVEHAIDRYTKCLIIREGFVIYNRLADRYTRIADVYERSIQAGLHANVPEMEKWQLYEYKTRDNSDKCYMQIPWSEIPEDPFFRSAKIRYQPNCNFRCNGKDTCTGRCGVKEEILDRHRMLVR
jgi:hypothetical protein